MSYQASIIRWKIQVHSYNGEALVLVVEHYVTYYFSKEWFSLIFQVEKPRLSLQRLILQKPIFLSYVVAFIAGGMTFHIPITLELTSWLLDF